MARSGWSHAANLVPAFLSSPDLRGFTPPSTSHRQVGMVGAVSGAAGDHALPQPCRGSISDLKRDIQFNTRVAAAQYDEATNRWTVLTAAGEQFSSKFLITAVGCLSTANVPKIPGLESFEGNWYHTGQWPHEGVDFTGKRVGSPPFSQTASYKASRSSGGVASARRSEM